MCTVVFIPTNAKPTFASLRDENPQRPKALAPDVYQLNEVNYLMPKDALAGGTWLGVNEFSNVIILLNGGYKKHKQRQVYLKSRGLIVAELLLSLMPVVDWQLMDLNNIEPFTLIVWSENNLFELVWDGQEKHRKRIDSSVPQIWSSSTLYNESSKLARVELFQNWIAMKPPISKLSLLNFFESIEDVENGFIINRKEVIKTLSYSFLELTHSDLAVMDYYDLQGFKHYQKTFELNTKSSKCLTEKWNTKPELKQIK